jgi:hypothetical protein
MSFPYYYENEKSSLRKCPRCDKKYNYITMYPYHWILYQCSESKCKYIFRAKHIWYAPINRAPIPIQ